MDREIKDRLDKIIKLLEAVRLNQDQSFHYYPPQPYPHEPWPQWPPHPQPNWTYQC